MSTNAEVGVGRLRVIVPKDVTVQLSIDVGVGDIQLPGDDEKDVDVAPGKHKEVTLAPAAGGKDAGTLDLDLQVGVGQAEVTPCCVMSSSPGKLVAGSLPRPSRASSTPATRAASGTPRGSW